MTDIPVLPSIEIPYAQYARTTVVSAYDNTMTIERVVEELRTYMQFTLIPYLNEQFPALEDAYVEHLGEALAAIAASSLPITDQAVLATLNSSTSAVRAWIDMNYGTLQAPKPNGADQTIILNTLYAVACATAGTVTLHPGTYNANILGPQSPTQGWIVGQGRKQTTIRAVTATAPVVKLRGGSGPVNGGGLRSLGLEAAAGGGGVALEFSGVTTCNAVDVDVFAATGDTFAVGVRFHNEDSGDFTEFCTFEGTINQTLRPVQYSVTAGNDSFHGSGIVGNSILGTVPSSTAPIITIDAGIGMPYNAPLSASIFTSNAGQVIISNGNTGNRDATFFGTLRIESSTAVTVATGAARTLFVGGIIFFGGGYSGLGRLFRAGAVNYDPNTGAILAQLEPVHTYNLLAAGTTQLTSAGFLLGGQQALVTVVITGPNYQQHHLLNVWQDNTADTGVITQLAHPKDFDSTTKGQPVFSWSGNALKVTNANYANTFTATVSITMLDMGVYGRSALTQ